VTNVNELEKIVHKGLRQAFHQDYGGEWLEELDNGDEVSLCTEEGEGDGFVCVNFPPGPEPDDEDEPWEEEGETKRFALEITVRLTEVP
jgi:hypothetical protein